MLTQEHIPLLVWIIITVLSGIIGLLIYIWQSTVLQFRKHIREIKEKTDLNEKDIHELELKIEKVVKEISESQHHIVTNYNSKFKDITDILHKNHEELITKFSDVEKQVSGITIRCQAIQDAKKTSKIRK